MNNPACKSVAIIIWELYNTCLRFHCSAHIGMIQTVQDETLSLHSYIFKFQFKRSGPHHAIKHNDRSIINTTPTTKPHNARHVLVLVLNRTMGPTPKMKLEDI